MWIDGELLKKVNPQICINKRLGLLPESRKQNGLALMLSIAKNTTQAALNKIRKGPFISLAKENKVAEKTVEDLRVVCPGIEYDVIGLSGGNQQKVVLGKWLFTESEILIFDEPTRGIDVGAKAEIYNIMNDFAAKGKTIIMVSSDLPEIFMIADRIYVMREGEIIADLDVDQTSQEEIISYATGGKNNED